MEDAHLTIRMTSAQRSVPLASFMTVANNTLGILTDLVLKLAEEDRVSVKWRIEQASLNSPLAVTLVGATDPNGLTVRDRAVELYLNGMIALEREAEMPDYFNELSLKKARAIVSVMGSDVTQIGFSSNGTLAEPTRHLAANVDSLLRPVEEYASIQGTLERISIHETDEFVVWDIFTGRPVKCRFAHSDLEQAKEAFGQTVIVYGLAKYSRAGRPETIQVEKIVVRPKPEERVRFSDVEGIDITSGEDPAEYIGRMRDSD
ncbi:MAG TPA: hypothetical protein VGM19_09075 [Armatimonadota bacterium]|jgi:hypothetical protein